MNLLPRQVDALFSSDGVVCASADETRQLARAVAEGLGAGSVLSLEGPLGAGKTCFTSGLVAGMGESAEVSSPSFSVLHEYPGGRLPVFHFDFYRMESVNELLTVGYDDCLPDSVTVVEWGDKFPEVLPPGSWRLQFEILDGGARRIRGVRV